MIPKTIGSTLVIGILSLFYSCSGQNISEQKNAPEVIQKSNSTIGTKVTEIEDGNMVMFQDSKNNYWFAGNDKGVYTYDGKDLYLITVEDGLCTSNIIGIQEDNHGSIFFDSEDGVCKFDGESFSTLEVINMGAVKNNWKLDPNDLWFRMGWNNNGPFRYDGEKLYYLEFPPTELGEQFYEEYGRNSYTPYGIYELYKDNSGNVWFGTSSVGLARYDGENIAWIFEDQLTYTPNGGVFGIRSIAEDDKGNFWICNSKNLFKFKEGHKTLNGTNYINYEKLEGVSNSENGYPFFMGIVMDSKQNLWMVSYDEGAWKYDPNYRNEEGENELILYPMLDGETGISIFDIYCDNQDGIWLITHKAGVYKFNGTEFEKFKSH